MTLTNPVRGAADTAATDAACPFCEIAARRDERTLLYDSDGVMAFEPLGPVVPGHLLVVPKRHVLDALDDPEVTAAVYRAAARIAFRPCNLITSAGTDATQSVFHLHVHVVPRRPDDGLLLPWSTPYGFIEGFYHRLSRTLGISAMTNISHPDQQRRIEDALAAVGSDTPTGTRTERVIEGYRWCPLLRDVYEWDEGQEQGCQWCDSDEPHQSVFRRVPSPHTDSSGRATQPTERQQ